MKKWKQHRFVFFTIFVLFAILTYKAQAQDSQELVQLKYFNDNNRVQYLVLEDVLKTGRKKAPLANKVFQLYLDSNTTQNFIAKVVTDKNGRAKSFLPPSLKTAWEASAHHKFIARRAGIEEPLAELDIAKAKIQIDTVVDGETRNIAVRVQKYENNMWLPAAEVEMQIGIRRLSGSLLSAGEEVTYTTDSSGTVSMVFNKDSIPGDEKGNIMLMAKVEDNDQYGNLLVEKTVNWAIAVKPDHTFFNQRELWSARPKPPFWLLIIANSILIGVWITIIYLIVQLIKLKRLGI